jgi:hypothetical protein
MFCYVNMAFPYLLMVSSKRVDGGNDILTARLDIRRHHLDGGWLSK